VGLDQAGNPNYSLLRNNTGNAILRGRIVRIDGGDNRMVLAKGDTALNASSIAGVTTDPSVLPGLFGQVIHDARVLVKFQPGLVPPPVAGEAAWLSETVDGQATNVQPLSPNIPIFLGIIKDTTDYFTLAEMCEVLLEIEQGDDAGIPPVSVPEVIVDANCLATDNVNDAVYERIPFTTKYQVSRADPHDFTKMPAIGILISKSSPTDCRVQFAGELAAYAGLTTGRTLFVGNAGIPTHAEPTPAAPDFRSYIQAIAVAIAADKVLVRPDGDAWEAHRRLTELIHFIEDGPAQGFATGAFKEILPAGSPFPLVITWWESAAKVKRIVRKTIERSAGPATNLKPTPILWEMFSPIDGVTVIASVSDAITYSGVFPTTVTRTIS
jgi:hypothetical protein